MTTRKPSSRYFRALALEPRILLDAAAVATAAAVAAQVDGTPAHDDTDAHAARTRSDAEQRGAELTAQLLAADEQGPQLGAQIGALDKAQQLTGNDWPDPYEGIQGLVSVGDQVYAVRTASEFFYDEQTGEFGNRDVSKLLVFTRAADGTLSQQTIIEASDANALAGAWAIGSSADGRLLHVTTDDGVALFQRDAESGALTAWGAIDGLGQVNDVAAVGDTLYVSSFDGLVSYQRQGDTWQEVDRQPARSPLAEFTALQVSADGQLLIAGSSGDSHLASVFRIGADGRLGEPTPVLGNAAEHYVSAFALSADGSTLYALDNGSTVHTLNVSAQGALTLAGSTSVSEGGKHLVTTQDGNAVMVVGSTRVELFSRADDGLLTLAQRASNLGGTEFGDLQGASLSADGKQLYLSGTFAWSPGVLVVDLNAASSTFTEKGEAVSLLPGGTLAAPALDTLGGGQGNYQGASIVISRDGAANADDRFSLRETAGLVLRDGTIVLNDVAIASLVSDGTSTTLTFTGPTSQAAAQLVLRNIVYSNVSKDPTADGNNARFVLRFNDGQGGSTEQNLQINLIGVNDPAIVDTTALQPTLSDPSERVPLFQGTEIDTVEAGQTIARVEITVTGVAAGDVLGIDGASLNLDRKVDYQAHIGQNRVEYRVAYDPKTAIATVTLYVNGSAQKAAAIIDSLDYSHTGDASSGERNVSLRVVERADGMGGNTTTEVAAKAVVTLDLPEQENTAPVLDDLPASVPFTERGEPVPLAPSASVADAQLDALNGGAGNYNGAVLQVSLGAGSGDADSLAFQAGNGLSLNGKDLVKDGKVIGTLSNADGVLSITFSDAGGVIPTTADVSHALQQITYANSSNVPPASVAVDIRLTDQRGLASEIATVVVSIAAINDAPVLSRDPALSAGELAQLQALDLHQHGLATPSASALSANGERLYISDDQGNIALFQRSPNGELTFVSRLETGNGIGQLQLSVDGKSLYALSSDGNAIIWLAADAQGALTVKGTLTSVLEVDDGNLNGMVDFTLSDDGKTLYLINQFSGQLAYLDRDPATGELSYVTALGGSLWSEPYLWAPTDMVARGDLLFVVTDSSQGSSLIVYQRAADGGLTVLTHTREGQDALQGMQHLSVSADGKTVYIANQNQVIAFTLDAANGALHYSGQIDSPVGIRDIATSADGQTLYVAQEDGTLSRYVGAALIPAGSQAVDAATHLLGTENGVLVLGSGASVIVNGEATGPRVEPQLGKPVLLAPDLVLSDAELDHADNYQGASLSISGQAGDRFGLQPGNGYRLDGNQVLLGDRAVATLVQDGTVATLTFTAAVSRAEATALVRQLSYDSVSDVPQSASAHRVTLVLRDGDGDDAETSASVSIEVTLLPANQPPVLGEGYQNYALPNAEAGSSYHLQLPADLFRDPEGEALSWSLSGLPAGLRFDAESRTLSGTAPRQMGDLQLTLSVTDASGKTAQLELILQVDNAEPIADLQFELAAAEAGADYSAVLPADLFTDANDSQLTWAVVELPEWLSYDADTRTLSGTAPDGVGNHSITLSATDPHGATVSRTLILAVALPPAQHASDTVLPELNTGFQPSTNAPAAARFGGPALNAPLFQSSDTPASDATETTAPAQPASTAQSLLRSDSGSGLADGRASLSEQLLNADHVLTDSGYQDARGSFSFDGTTLRSSVDLAQGTARSISLQLPAEPGIRITQSNGMPLPSGVSFDSRTGELRIDRERLQRDGVLRLTLISRDDDGKEQRTPVEIRAEGTQASNASEAPRASATQIESLPQRLQQETSSALLGDALDLLDQLSDLAGEPVVITTRHSA